MTKVSRRHSAGFSHVFGMPMLLALITAIGLVSALLGDTVWDSLSWCALGLPIGVIFCQLAHSRMRCKTS